MRQTWPSPKQLSTSRWQTGSLYADKLRHIVAAIEIVSPGNKASHVELRAFVERVSRLVRHGNALARHRSLSAHRSRSFRNSQSNLGRIHGTILRASDGKSRAGGSIQVGIAGRRAFVETISLGGKLPDMPLFLKGDSYVPAPLEASYQTAWADFPAPMKRLLVLARRGYGRSRVTSRLINL